MNTPNTPLAHLGCAACVLIAATSGTIASAQPAFQEWLCRPPSSCPCSSWHC